MKSRWWLFVVGLIVATGCMSGGRSGPTDPTDRPEPTGPLVPDQQPTSIPDDTSVHVAPTDPPELTEPPPEADDPWTVPVLDELAALCGDGELGKCDDLAGAPGVTPGHRLYATKCGGRVAEQAIGCAVLFGASTPPVPIEFDSSGQDATWASSAQACESGDLQACDALRAAQAVSPTYGDYASSCGGRINVYKEDCKSFFERTQLTAVASVAPTGDAVRDANIASCQASIADACQALALDTTASPDDQKLGATCGGLNRTMLPPCTTYYVTTPWGTPTAAGGLADIAGWTSPSIDECFDGDLAACDALIGSTFDSPIIDWATTCAGRVDHVAGCQATFGGAQPPKATPPVELARTPELDALLASCTSDGADACDELAKVAPADSGYLAAGRTCGDRGPTNPCAAAAPAAPVATDPPITDAPTTDPPPTEPSVTDKASPEPPATTRLPPVPVPTTARVTVPPLPPVPTTAVPATTAPPQEVEWLIVAAGAMIAESTVTIDAPAVMVSGDTTTLTVNVETQSVPAAGKFGSYNVAPVLTGASGEAERQLLLSPLRFTVPFTPPTPGQREVSVSSIRVFLAGSAREVKLKHPATVLIKAEPPPSAPPVQPQPDLPWWEDVFNWFNKVTASLAAVVALIGSYFGLRPAYRKHKQASAGSAPVED